MTPPRRNSWTAALLALCAMQMLPLGDGIAKHLSADYPVLQLVWARFFFHFVFAAPAALVRFSPAAFRVPHPLVQLRRGAFLAAATLLFFSSFRHLPLADAIALLFTSPILLVLLSRFTLGERVGLDRWLAVTVGFVAVLLIVRPGFASFHWASLLALGAAFAFTLYLRETRLLSGTAPPLVTLVYQSLVPLAALSLVAPLVWVWPAPGDWLLMAAIGAAATGGHFLLIKSFEYADASFVAPFNYTEIIMATVIGYLLFGDLPDLWTWTGIALIIATAVYLTLPARRPG